MLGGAPGIYSARYSGEDATDLKNLQKLLETLKDVPDDQRQARFHCVLVYLRHAEDPTPLVCHGSWPGVITREPAALVALVMIQSSSYLPKGKPLPN
ncbi:deoxyribonucleotide triphosphate pyrophosphatase [Escherichia coli]|uniref:Deoxyribonucleotide triphosphate pyrophosphatase n=1 Tax=Escherichia coli TaxID=562 RepID=A0A2X1K876_ECOLX|nr:deoxyribonucleotide triphosphate pyrophosphatase [Escherichia coli]